MTRLKIPVGVSDFEKIRQNGYYYVDKTPLISALLNSESTEVTLIIRPRRFGKTMAMSMLASFLIFEKITVLYLKGCLSADRLNCARTG